MLAQLEADRARVADIEKEIQQLERSISQLRSAQSQAQERLDSYNLYPVLTLPNELVSEIFMRVLPPHPDFPQPIGSYSPTLLTQICQSWRAIALATPKLWSAISSFDNIQGGRGLHIFELWLKRSRYCPLSLRLGSKDHWASEELVDAIIPHRARWQYLKIDIEMENFRIFDGPMPLLQYLDLYLGDGPPDGVSLHEAPLLRTVALNAAAALWVVLPWAQLTSLTLLRVYPYECVPLLVQARNLVRCELDLFFFDELGHSFEPRDITFPYLESLVLTDPGNGSATDFLPTLILPALRSLKIPETFLSPNLLSH